MIKECKGKDYELRLRSLNLTTLETRRTRADMIEVWKIVNGLEGITEEVFSLGFCLAVPVLSLGNICKNFVRRGLNQIQENIPSKIV